MHLQLFENEVSNVLKIRNYCRVFLKNKNRKDDRLNVKMKSHISPRGATDRFNGLCEEIQVCIELG